MIRAAEFSDCNLYRYTLTRIWDETKPIINWIGLNPSTADAMLDDPTIRREMNFSRRWGYGGMIKTNLYAYRATDPRDMASAPEPIGRDNDLYIESVARKSNVIVFAWGTHAMARARAEYVATKILVRRQAWCLGVTSEGFPRHPVRLRADLELEPFLWRKP